LRTIQAVFACIVFLAFMNIAELSMAMQGRTRNFSIAGADCFDASYGIHVAEIHLS